jgi:rubredoxin
VKDLGKTERTLCGLAYQPEVGELKLGIAAEALFEKLSEN